MWSKNINTCVYSAIIAVAENQEFNHINSGFIPIQEISNVSGNIVIVFLSGNRILFPTPHDDGWYRAKTAGPKLSTTASTGKAQAYTFDEAASPLGCLQQWQWCNSAYPGTSGCGPLASSLDAIIGALPKFNLTLDQLTRDSQERVRLHTAAGARLNWSFMMHSFIENGIASIIATLGTRSLVSQSSLYSGVQTTLSENQWQLDVTNWWNIMLATYQSAFVETAIGEADPELQPVLLGPSNKYEQQVCKSQVHQYPNSERLP